MPCIEIQETCVNTRLWEHHATASHTGEFWDTWTGKNENEIIKSYAIATVNHAP